MVSTISRRKKRVALAAAVVVTITGAGAAYAFWSSTGHGDGTATTGTSADFNFVTTGEAGTIEPGGPGKTVTFRVTNPGPGTQSLSSVTVAIADENGDAWVPTGTAADCNTAWYTATITTPPTAGPVLKDGFVDGTATVKLLESGTNQDACKTAEVPLHFVVVPVAVP